MVTQHPFAGRKGSAIRTQFAAQLFVEQLGKCSMCGTAIDPTLTGKTDRNHGIVDHITPWRLDPSRAYDKDNLHLICRQCDGVCQAIEKRHAGSAKAIASAKKAHRPVGLDGYRVGGG